MPLAVAWSDFGHGKAAPAASPLTDTMNLPAVSNAVLFLLMMHQHNGTMSTGGVTLTGESVTELRAFDNPSTVATLVNAGAFAVRNPGSGVKTLSLADDGLLRSFAWAGWLVTGVPASAFTDDIQATTGSTSSSTTQGTGTVTTTKPNGLILSMWGFRGQTGPFSLTNGWVEDGDDSTGLSTTTDFGYVAAHKVATAAGAYSSTATATAAGRPAVISVSVLPSLRRRAQAFWS